MDTQPFLLLLNRRHRGVPCLVTLAVAARDRKSYTIGAVKSRAKRKGGA